MNQRYLGVHEHPRSIRGGYLDVHEHDEGTLGRVHVDLKIRYLPLNC